MIQANCDAHCHFQNCPDQVAEPEFESVLDTYANEHSLNISVHV